MGLFVNPSEVCVRHGRQFHGSGSNYGLPIQLHCTSTAIKLGRGPKDILDVASGSGIWVIEIAREFPQSRVVGIDLSKPGFLGQDVPENASFIVADITKRFPFEDASFDVVQMRIVPSVSERTLIYQEIHRVLRPGGVIQLVELSPPVSRKGTRPPALDEIDQAVARGGHVHKKNENKPSLDVDGKPEYWSIASRIAPVIRASPLMWGNVHEKKFGVPIGVWSNDEVDQEAGRIMKRQTVELYSGFRPNLIDIGGMAEDKVDEIIARLTDELEDGPKWQLETLYDFIWAIKA
ncbi:S-adenosyl-L-methionine-dependent methyltransferase [Rhizoctonia solani]|nr:S-adenosyl-L-methionine-dependent methyltransferase [Rhizoctonia solani]